jgi:AraC-like DNA-binding protein
MLLAAAIEMLKQKTFILLSLQGASFQVSQTVRNLVLEKKALITSIRHDGELIDLSIGNIANILGLNVRSLQRKLKLEGSGFTELKNQTLVEESKRWMDDGQNNLDIISETLGFSDRASFSKVYKKYEGVWPAKYRPNT